MHAEGQLHRLRLRSRQWPFRHHQLHLPQHRRHQLRRHVLPLRHLPLWQRVHLRRRLRLLHPGSGTSSTSSSRSDPPSRPLPALRFCFLFRWLRALVAQAGLLQCALCERPRPGPGVPPSRLLLAGSFCGWSGSRIYVSWPRQAPLFWGRFALAPGSQSPPWSPAGFLWAVRAPGFRIFLFAFSHCCFVSWDPCWGLAVAWVGRNPAARLFSVRVCSL